MRQNRQQKQHLCLDRAYNSKSTENEIINRGMFLICHSNEKRTNKKRYSSSKNKRWVVERTNSWHNRFRKLFTRYEKKVENYLGLVHLSNSIIIYRKIILG